MKSLESELGVRLFDRHARVSPRPTPAARSSPRLCSPSVSPSGFPPPPSAPAR
ncbi:hypothetical protein [Streptomyces sp. NPDC056323]|uniref:hypothetical protein n=1 Tax=unclassified Streptomyces TaxID=2593676 RepID=UPI0035DDF886